LTFEAALNFNLGHTLRLMYEMLTGRRPFQRVDRALTSAAILLEEPTVLTEVGAELINATPSGRW
jgi:hypothetical protein